MSKPKRVKFGRPKNSDSGKTQIWSVLDSSGMLLGQIKWFGQWRKYAFYPLGFTVYEQDCLRTIADFCEQKSKKLHQKWRKHE